MTTIPRLTKNEIECRVAQTGKSKNGAWCSILLYKDARVDMRILDEVYGSNNWQRTHELIGDRLYCTISIWDAEKGQWIKKQDVGTESYTEKEKGQASDSFKRAGFNVGIGRELYTAPKIFINLDEKEWDDKSGKIVPKISFEVEGIDYDDYGNIDYLVISNGKGKTLYTFGKPHGKAKDAPAPKAETPVKELMNPQHEKWLPMLQSILDDKYTIEKAKARYTILEEDEFKMKEWLITNQK